MADPQQVELILDGTAEWNKWRTENDSIQPDLHLAYLSGADLGWAYLSGADLGWANLSGADLTGAHLIGAHLSRAGLRQAQLIAADLGEADLSVRATQQYLGHRNIQHTTRHTERALQGFLAGPTATPKERALFVKIKKK